MRNVVSLRAGSWVVLFYPCLLALAISSGCSDDDTDSPGAPKGGSGGAGASGAGTKAGSGGSSSGGRDSAAHGGHSAGHDAGGAPVEGGRTNTAGSSATSGGNSRGGTSATTSTTSAGGHSGGEGATHAAGESGAGGEQAAGGTSSSGGQPSGAGGSDEGGAAGAGGNPVTEPGPVLPVSFGNGVATQRYTEGPDQAFDADYQTKWLTFHDASWIQYEFEGDPVTISGYVLVSGNDAEGRDPRDWVLLGNNRGPDGDEASDAEWTVLDSRTDQDAFAERNAPYSFALSSPGAYRFLRLKITRNNGEGILQLSEIEFHGPGGNLISGGAVRELYPRNPDDEGEGPSRAFDGDPQTKWFSGAETTWLKYSFPAVTPEAPKRVVKYAITSANDAPDRDPSDWVLQGSNSDLRAEGDAGWTTLDSRSGVRWPDDPENVGQPRRFHTLEFDCQTAGAFRHYRFKVLGTADHGPAQIAELSLFQQ